MNTKKSLVAAAPLLGLMVLVSGCATSAAAQSSVDPLTCYIDSDGPSIDPKAVTLRCGGGVEATIDLTEAKPSTDPATSVGEWDITGASVGTSDVGSSIVRVFTEQGSETCVYHRDLADQAQDSSTDCR